MTILRERFLVKEILRLLEVGWRTVLNCDVEMDSWMHLVGLAR